jgi:Insecticide toxin TcdB middle/N-terminal region/FG-GAP-like repeat/Salmonella virulence plasmid 65kDa B protein
MQSAKFSLWRWRSATRIVAVALSASFTFSPLSVALAQEAPPEMPADPGTSTAPVETPPAPDFSIPGVDNAAEPGAPAESIAGTTPPPETPSEQIDAPIDQIPDGIEVNPPEDQQASLLSSFGDGSPTVPSPTVFTSLSTAPKVDGQTGALTKSIKPDIPPGRNGLQPDLTLRYNNHNTEDGIVGYGWTVSIPYIQRLNKLGSQSLYNFPYFASSIDGELATTSSATTTMTFGAKVDDGSFNAYSFANNMWTMYDKNGTRYTFGASDNAQQNASASSTQIYKWMLQEIRDTNNNYVRYVYTKDSGQIYPSQIIYTGNGVADGIFTITFTTASRPDPRTNYLPGFSVTTNYRISKIEASVNGNVVREYNLSYTSGNNGKRSLLSAVQENGWDANHQNQVTYPATSLAYTSSSALFIAAGSERVRDSAYIVTDANGDSINDTTVFVVSGSTIGEVFPNGAPPSTVINPAPEYWASGSGCGGYAPVEIGTRYLDVNADGKADVLRGVHNTSSGDTFEFFRNAYTGSGYSWTSVATTSWNGIIPAFSLQSGTTYTTGIFGDVNADGLPDFELRLSGFGNEAYLGNGTTWDSATTTIFAPVLAMPFGGPDEHNNQLIDINGDGLADWMYSDSGAVTYFRLNTGSGWDATPAAQWTLATSTTYLAGGGTAYYDRGMRFLDINGDGLADFVRSFSGSTAGHEIANFKFVMLNTGNGWATSTAYTIPSYITTDDAGGVCFNEYANWTGNGQEAQDVLSTITYPQGGTDTITYQKSGQSGNSPELPYSLLTVASVTSDDGFANTIAKNYTYSGALQYQAQGARERRFAGFASVTETDANTKTVTYFDQANALDTGNGEQADGYGQMNHAFRVDVRKVSDNCKRWNHPTWTGCQVRLAA